MSDALNEFLSTNGITTVLLSKHETARNKAVANGDLPPGTTIVESPALSVVLSSAEKGNRCDACFRCPTTEKRLKKCSGCAEYWYCDPVCQKEHWRTVHRHMCKSINGFLSSSRFQALLEHERMDALLLSHLLAEHHKALASSGRALSTSVDVFLDLLPFESSSPAPPIVGTDSPRLGDGDATVDAIYARFANNNFVVHSHLDHLGHGVFPLASRLFNHSCTPNAIMAFAFRDNGRPPVMRVRALRAINDGEEITVPYFDAALPFQRRQEVCRYSYGFTCACPSCALSSSTPRLRAPPAPPRSEEDEAALERALCLFAFPNAPEIDWPPASSSSSSPLPLLASLPASLSPVLHEAYLPALSSRFRDAAHDGPFELALARGLALLAVYMVVYPPCFPQTGMHLLELAKTAWNVTTTLETDEEEGETKRKQMQMLASSRRFLDMAARCFAVLGEEGDEGRGPVLECAALRDLLDS